MAQRPPQNNGLQGLKNLAEAARKAAESRQAKEAEPQPEEPNPMAMTISKPDEQDIGDVCIMWRWVSGRYVVLAYYARKENNLESMPAGSYWVRYEPTDDYPLSAEESKSLAEILMSAYRWKDIWQNYMGEFFLADVKPKLAVVHDDDVPPVEEDQEQEELNENEEESTDDA